MIKKIKTSLTAKIFLSTMVLLILVCLLSVFSMARYIPETYSSSISAKLQKQANDLIPDLENADTLEDCFLLVRQFAAQTKATAYIEDESGEILYSSDEISVTMEGDVVATVKEHSDSETVSDDGLLSDAGYVFTLSGKEYTLYVQGDTVSINQAAEAVRQTIPPVIAGIFLLSILFSVIYSGYITKLKRSNLELEIEISKERELEQRQQEGSSTRIF